jgi:hypothetical protein
MGKAEHEHNFNDHWCTPESIGLDPFWNPATKVPATHRFTNWTRNNLRYTDPAWSNVTFDVDSFTASWDGYGLVYVNGPFSRAGEYLKRCATQGDEVIFLCKANMNAAYVHEYALVADRLAFPSRRLKFDPHPFVDRNDDQATFHVMLGYWGTRTHLFEQTFGDTCWVVPGKGAQPPRTECRDCHGVAVVCENCAYLWAGR